MRHRILLQTNPTWIRTGLAENAKTLLSYLWKTGRYDVAHLCTQGTSVLDPRLTLSPWKSYGCMPADPSLIASINSDPNLQRNASYGSYGVDAAIKDWKPTIYICSDDIWAMPLADYVEKPWYSQINSIPHITIDSIPVLDQAFEQARRSKHYLTWARFAAREMQRVRPDGSMSHVSSIYGAMDTTRFSPISEAEKADVRRRFGIDPEATVFIFVSRNQLRKSFPQILRAFAHFRREHPGVKAHLHFHTSFSEKGAGFDIPKIAGYLGIPISDILCTYVCRQCGRWWVAPYAGEDVKCPYCGAEKGGITVNIVNSVPAMEMRYVYGIADAALQVHTSGGQELNACQAMLCARPLAITQYACGEDYCTEETSSFVHPLKWHTYDEMGTSFFKAATDPKDIAAFMRKVLKSSKRDLQEMGERSRAWAVKTFSIETVGKQWEDLLARLPYPDWSSITLTGAKAKNESFPMPGPEVTDTDFVQSLYKGVLLMDERLDGEGQRHWEDRLKAGITRQQVYDYFISVARQENAKNRPPVDFSSLLDNTGRPRVLFVIKESLGDVVICTALFRSIHEQHPGCDLYVATDPKYAAALMGNEYVYKVLPYIPQMEQELAMIGQGKSNRHFAAFYHPGILTQRQLGYLSRPEPAFSVDYPA